MARPRGLKRASEGGNEDLRKRRRETSVDAKNAAAKDSKDVRKKSPNVMPVRVSERISTRGKLARRSGTSHFAADSSNCSTKQQGKVTAVVKKKVKQAVKNQTDAKKETPKAKSSKSVSKANLATAAARKQVGSKGGHKKKATEKPKKDAKKVQEVKKQKIKKDAAKKKTEKTVKKDKGKPKEKTMAKTQEVKKRKTKKDELNERRMRVKVVPNDQLTPNLNIKVVQKDPMFEDKNEAEMPEVSKFVQCKRSIRAVLTNDMHLLKKLIENKNVPSVFYKRSVSVENTALDYAVRTENHAALRLLLPEIVSSRERVKLPGIVMEHQSSGRAAFAGSGYPGQNVFMGRGNKEGNNAFTKDLDQKVDLRKSYVDEIIKWGVSTSTIDLILATDEEAKDQLFRSIHKIARAGHYKLAGYLVEKARTFTRLGFNKVHQEVLLAEQPEDLTPCLTISVKKKAWWEVDKITPVHCAAINPNPKILEKLMSILPEYSITDSYGLRPIHYAAACEGSGPLEFLLDRGVNPDDKHTGGVTPLMMAAKLGRAQNVEILLKKIEEKSKPEDSSGVKNVTSGGNMAIHFASEGGSVDCVQSLVNHGANIGAKMGAFYNNITPLMIATLHGHSQLVEALLDLGAVIEQKDKFNRTALMLACMEGHYPIATSLLRRGANPNAQDSSGNAPTHYAAAYGWWHCLKLLLKAGADPNITNDWKTTPLGVAFMKGHIGCSDLLLEQPTVDVNFPDCSGATLLSLTAASPMTKDMVNQIHYLLEKKADLTLVDIHGRNAFHYLATSGSPRYCNEQTKKAVKIAKQEVAKLLIKKGCDASARDKDGNTAVNLALQQVGSSTMALEFVELLLERGFTLSMNEREEDGKNALHMMATNCAAIDMGALLPVIAKNMMREKSQRKTGPGSQARRVVTLEEAAKMTDHDGYTPLLRCVSQSYPSKNEKEIANILSMMQALVKVAKSDVNAVVAPKGDYPYVYYSALHIICKYAENSTPALKQLLKWKPNLEIFNKDGLTPLHLSVKGDQKENTELLVSAGADVNKCTLANTTALLIAASMGLYDILPILVASGAEVNAADPDTKKSALHHVVTGHNISHILACCKVLLKAGAEPNALDAKERTPLHYAVNLDGGSFDGAPSISELLIENGANVFVQDIRGRLPLHYAFVKMKNHLKQDKTDPIEIVTLLLKAMKGQKVDTQDKFGRTPLHWAAYRGATISAKSLMQKSKHLEIKGNDGNTPLAMTSLGGHDSVSIVLIEAGANINIPVTFVPPELERLADRGPTKPSKTWVWKPLVKPPLVPITASFVQAVLGEGWESVIFLIMERLQKFHLSFMDVMQAIFECQKLQLACTMLLKQPDDKKVQAADGRNRNFLHLLAIHASLDDPVKLYEEIANPLLERGVKLFAKDDKGCTPLHYAAANQNAELCKLFAEKDEACFKKCLSCKDSRGRTPTIAVFWNIGFNMLTMEVIRLFSKHDASLDVRAQLPDIQAHIPQKRADTIDAWYHGPLDKSVSSTPLILFIRNNDFNGCQFLLRNGASCNYADEQGLTPLMHVVKQNKMALLQLLLNHDFSKEFPRGQGRIPAKSLSTWAVNLWEQRKSQGQDKNCYIKGNTVEVLSGLDYVGKVSDYEVRKALEEEDEKMDDEAEEEEEEVEDEDEDDQKELHEKAGKEKETAQEAREKKKKQQLEEEKRLAAARKLAETSKVDLNAVDRAGHTAVHHLVKTHPYGTHENVIMLDLLFRVGAKISLKDKEERTPLDYARDMRSVKLASAIQRFMKIPQSKWKLPTPTSISWTGVDPVKVDFQADAQAMIKQLESSTASKKTKGKKQEEETKAEVDPLSKLREGGVVLVDEDQGIPFDALLTRVDVKHGVHGMNNFYKMQIIHQKGKDMIVLFTRWGRIGEEGQYQRTPFSTKEEASKEFRKIFRAKTRTDWADVKNFQKVDKKYQLVPEDPWRARRKEALKEFQFDLKSKVPSRLPNAVQEAIKELIKPDILAKALSHSGIDRSIMNMGNHLPRESLLKAKEVLVKIREILEEVEDYKKGPKQDMQKYQESMDKVWDLSSEYYQLIPCVNFTYDRIPPLTDLSALGQNAKKLEILLDLATTNLILLGAQYRVKEINPLDYIYSCLGCQMKILDEDDEETQLILQYIHNTTDKSKHKVKAIFRLAREGEEKELRSLKLDNHRLLWHGSKCSNVISILKRGLLVTPPEAAVTGYRYGRGIYTSDAFAKSIDYSIESFGIKNASFVFLCEVALGNMAVDPSKTDSVVKDGFDSLQAQSGKNTLLPSRNVYLPQGFTIPLARLKDESNYTRYWDYTEYVVHKESQVCLRYLIQCHPEKEDDDDNDDDYDDDDDDDYSSD